MDINEIMNAITTVGFPIVCCVAMFYKMNKDNERHSNEMNSVREALTNNTVALTELKEKLNNVHDTDN